MSADLGYFHIEFLKRDGSPDVETAQRAFEWCQDRYDWFDEAGITLEDHCIIGDGLDVEDTDIPCDRDSIRDLIDDIGAGGGAVLILASVIISWSKSKEKHNLVYEDGGLKSQNYEFFEYPYKIAGWGEESYVCDSTGDDGYIYRGLFRNKKTGVEKNLGYLIIDDSGFYRFSYYDNIDGDPELYVCNDEGETVKAPDEDIYNYSCFGIEDDEGSVSNVPPCEVLSSWQMEADLDEILDVSEWEFVRFNAYRMYDLLDRTRARVCSPTVVVIPEGTTTIEDGAYSGYTHISSVEIPSSVTSIGDYAFRGCKGLTSVTIPDGVTSIGFSAFYGCTGLTSVTIPDSVTEIGKEAFRGCKGLTSVTIPNSVTSIGEDAFAGCPLDEATRARIEEITG